GTGPENGIPDECIAVAPERGVVAVRPEREGQEIAEEVRPKYWSGPPAPSSVPAAAPMRITPLAPGGLTAHCSGGAQRATMWSVNVGKITARADVSNFCSPDVRRFCVRAALPTNMRRTTKVFAAAEVFAATPMPMPMPMPMPTTFGHRSLSTQTYQR